MATSAPEAEVSAMAEGFAASVFLFDTLKGVVKKRNENKTHENEKQAQIQKTRENCGCPKSLVEKFSSKCRRCWKIIQRFPAAPTAIPVKG